MKTLAELLIEACINPFELPRDVEYIAQDKFTLFTYLYKSKPCLASSEVYGVRFAIYCYVFNGNYYLELNESSDWETPLHIDTYKQAWEAAKMNNVKEITYPCLMQSVLNGQVVRFDKPASGKVVKEGGANCVNKGFYSREWMVCTNKEVWKPYVEATQTPPVELSSSPEPTTAQEIVKRLGELKTSLEDNDDQSLILNEQHTKLMSEYDSLKEQLLILI